MTDTSRTTGGDLPRHGPGRARRRLQQQRWPLRQRRPDGALARAQRRRAGGDRSHASTFPMAAGRARASRLFLRRAQAKPPLFVFIHGGYWQRNDKDMFAFVADGPRAARHRRRFGRLYAGAGRAPDRHRGGDPQVAELSCGARRRVWLRSRPAVRRRLVGRRPSHRDGRASPGLPRRHSRSAASSISSRSRSAISTRSFKLDAAEIATLSPLRALPERIAAVADVRGRGRAARTRPAIDHLCRGDARARPAGDADRAAGTQSLYDPRRDLPARRRDHARIG